MPDRREDLTVPLSLLESGARQHGPRRFSRTLTARAVLVACAVAMISVLVTALVAVPLAVRAADQRDQATLAQRADLVAQATGARLDRGRVLAVQLAIRQLRKQGVDVYAVRSGRPDRGGLPAAVVRAVAAGKPVSVRAAVAGRRSIVEARPLPDGDGLVLVEPTRTGIGILVVANLWLPLLAGLAAGVVAGVLLARRLSRPIRNAATAAVRLRGGDRTVRVPVEPPAEAEELAWAINNLAADLAVSESRQREFLLSVSHELRTPLTAIRGYAEAFADGVVVGAAATQQAGRTVLAEAERLDRLVSDLLALARLDAVDFPVEVAQVDLTQLVATAAAAWSARCATADVVPRTELPGHPVLVYTDPGRIRQVVDGLLENALRVMPAGAPLVLAVYPPVAAGPVPPAGGTGAVPAWAGSAGAGPGGSASAGVGPGGSASPGAGRGWAASAGAGPGGGPAGAGLGHVGPGRSPMAVLEVRDGGPGLTDADLAVVFERGALHRRYQGVRKVGSGLGLALAAGLVGRRGGAIAAGHAPEGGARFTVWLPAASLPNPYTRLIEPSSPGGTLGPAQPIEGRFPG